MESLNYTRTLLLCSFHDSFHGPCIIDEVSTININNDCRTLMKWGLNTSQYCKKTFLYSLGGQTRKGSKSVVPCITFNIYYENMSWKSISLLRRPTSSIGWNLPSVINRVTGSVWLTLYDPLCTLWVEDKRYTKPSISTPKVLDKSFLK